MQGVLFEVAHLQCIGELSNYDKGQNVNKNTINRLSYGDNLL